MEQYSDILPCLQKLHVRTLSDIDRICKKYGIQYFAICGTLLGTIRHKGFIPWDDDLDIGMLREDFIKLCAVPKKEWGDRLFLCAPDTDNEIHDKFFGRVYIANSKVQSEVDVENWLNWSDNKPWSTSLMCDIFIYDYAPENHDDFMRIKSQCAKYRNLYSITRHKPYALNGTLKKKVKRFIKSMYAKRLRSRWNAPWKHFDELAQQEIEKGYTGGKILGCYRSGDPCFNYTYSYDDIFPLVEMPFENITIPVPKEWDRMLTEEYGDYMTPPPVSKRAHLVPCYMDLGDGIEHIFSKPLPGSLGDHK